MRLAVIDDHSRRHSAASSPRRAGARSDVTLRVGNRLAIAECAGAALARPVPLLVQSPNRSATELNGIQVAE